MDRHFLRLVQLQSNLRLHDEEELEVVCTKRKLRCADVYFFAGDCRYLYQSTYLVWLVFPRSQLESSKRI